MGHWEVGHMTNYQNGQKTKVVALHCSILNLVELYSEVLLLWRLGALYTPPPIPTGVLLDFTRTPANFILADHHTNLASQSYWSPSKFLLESLRIVDS